MPVRWVKQVLPLCVVATLVASCCCHKNKSEVYYTGWVPPGNVPPALEEIGDCAVNVIDAAAVEDWPRVYVCVQKISDRWYDFKHPTVQPTSYPRPAAALLYGQVDTAVARLKEAASARNTVETMRAANDVDGATIELIEFYHPGTPPDLHRLAVLQRKVLLYSWKSNLDDASDTLIEVRRTWGRVRPTIVNRSGEQVAQTIDGSIADQQAAIDANEPIRLANYAEINLITIREMQQLSY